MLRPRARSIVGTRAPSSVESLLTAGKHLTPARISALSTHGIEMPQCQPEHS